MRVKPSQKQPHSTESGFHENTSHLPVIFRVPFSSMGSQRRLGFDRCWVKATIPSPSPLRNWISSALDHDKPRVGRRSSRTINHCARARELCPRRGRYGGGEAFHTGADAGKRACVILLMIPTSCTNNSLTFTIHSASSGLPGKRGGRVG